MAKYMILYNSTASASELMANATADEMKASMAEWRAWSETANKSAKFDFGMPLQADSVVTADGTQSSDSHVSGYSTMEADTKEIIIELLKSHPHLKRQGASIEVLEVLSMPGM